MFFEGSRGAKTTAESEKKRDRSSNQQTCFVLRSSTGLAGLSERDKPTSSCVDYRGNPPSGEGWGDGEKIGFPLRLSIFAVVMNALVSIGTGINTQAFECKYLQRSEIF